MKKAVFTIILILSSILAKNESFVMYPTPPECSGGNPADVTSAYNPQTGTYESWASCLNMGPNGSVRTIIGYTPCPYCPWQPFNPM